MKGKYVIVRADRAGVFFGKLEEKRGREVTLSDVRKLWYWDGANAVEEIAMIGTKKPNNCKFTVSVSSMLIDECLQVISCTDEAVKTIKSVKEWKS